MFKTAIINKKARKCFKVLLRAEVNPLGLFSNLFIEDLKKLVEIIAVS